MVQFIILPGFPLFGDQACDLFEVQRFCETDHCAIAFHN